MLELKLTSSSLKEIFKQLQLQFEGDYSYELNEHTLDIDNQDGKGKVRGLQLRGGIAYLEISGVFYQDTSFSIISPKEEYVNFAYCTGGHVAHWFEDKEETMQLKPFQMAILANIQSNQNTLFFEKNKDACVTLITVHCTEKYAEKPLQGKLLSTFIKPSETDFLHKGTYNLKIGESIKQLQDIGDQGIVRKLMIEGFIRIILAMEIKQHAKDIEFNNENQISLEPYELENISRITDYINSHLSDDLSISTLSDRSMLSPAKLQEGFKLTHNNTVNEYIREQRIRKAEELIKNSDMNISQVVYTVGFSSRSYFSKIFKEKYNCSPNKYKIQSRREKIA